MTAGELRRTGRRRAAVFRWECPCRAHPVLLATYDANGRINIKVRDRYWHVDGQVRTVCPVCGAEHILDLRGLPVRDRLGATQPEDARVGDRAPPPEGAG
jgi:hypothetical protein